MTSDFFKEKNRFFFLKKAETNGAYLYAMCEVWTSMILYMLCRAIKTSYLTCDGLVHVGLGLFSDWVKKPE